jgi:hypothetical protein
MRLRVRIDQLNLPAMLNASARSRGVLTKVGLFFA